MSETEEAIAQWDRQAEYYARLGGRANDAASKNCRLAAESLRLKLKTGIAHCGCTDPPHPIDPDNHRIRHGGI